MVRLQYDQSNVEAYVHVSWLDPSKIREVTVVGSEEDGGLRRRQEPGAAPPVRLGRGPRRSGANFQAPMSYRYGDITSPFIDFEEPLMLEDTPLREAIRSGRAVEVRRAGRGQGGGRRRGGPAVAEARPGRSGRPIMVDESIPVWTGVRPPPGPPAGVPGADSDVSLMADSPNGGCRSSTWPPCTPTCSGRSSMRCGRTWSPDSAFIGGDLAERLRGRLGPTTAGPANCGGGGQRDRLDRADPPGPGHRPRRRGHRPGQHLHRHRRGRRGLRGHGRSMSTSTLATLLVTADQIAPVAMTDDTAAIIAVHLYGQTVRDG